MAAKAPWLLSPLPPAFVESFSLCSTFYSRNHIILHKALTWLPLATRINPDVLLWSQRCRVTWPCLHPPFSPFSHTPQEEDRESLWSQKPCGASVSKDDWSLWPLRLRSWVRRGTDKESGLAHLEELVTSLPPLLKCVVLRSMAYGESVSKTSSVWVQMTWLLQQ